MAGRVEEVALPDLPKVLSRVGPGEVVAARPYRLDLVQRQGLVVGGQRRHERLGPAEQVVAEDDRLVTALQAALEVAHVVQQRPAREPAEDGRQRRLRAPL